MHSFVAKISWLLILTCNYHSQNFKLLRHNSKYVVFFNNQKLDDVLYDSVILPNSYNPFCILCNKKDVVYSKLIITKSKKWFCQYLTSRLDKLTLFDTLNTFSLPYDTISVVIDKKKYYKVKYEKKYFLLDDNLHVLLRRAYAEVVPVLSGKWYIVTDIMDNGSRITFVGNGNDEVLIEPRFSAIKYNDTDSLFIACSSGMVKDRPDEIIDLTGKTLFKYYSHIVDANKRYAMVRSESQDFTYKIFELSTLKEVNVKSKPPPVLIDSLIKINSNGSSEIYTFDKLIKIQTK